MKRIALVSALTALMACGTSGDVLRSRPTEGAREPADADAGTGADASAGPCSGRPCVAEIVATGNGFTPGGALALTSSHVVWIAYTDGSLRAAPLGGGAPITLATRVGGTFALTGRRDDVFLGTWETTGPIDRVSRTSIAASPLVDLGAGYEGITGLAADESGIYWATGRGTAGIYRRAEGGASAEPLETELPATQLVLGASDVFFTSSSGPGRVARVPKTGGSPTVLAEEEAGVWGIDAAGDTIAWACNAAGVVRRSRQDGTGIVTLARGLDGPHSVVLDGVDTYVSLKQGAALLRIRDGVVQELVKDPGRPQTLLLRNRTLYWANETGVIHRLAL